MKQSATVTAIDIRVERSSRRRIWTRRRSAKDTPSLIEVEGFGRPPEFSGREEDFQQWSKKTEAFFVGVI